MAGRRACVWLVGWVARRMGAVGAVLRGWGGEVRCCVSCRWWACGPDREVAVELLLWDGDEVGWERCGGDGEWRKG